MRKLTLIFLIGLTGIANAQWGSGGLFRFYASGTAVPLTDSVRVIAGTGMVITKSGNQITFASTAVAPAGSVDSTSIVNVSVAATDLVNGSILNAKIASGAITVNKFATSVYPAICGKVGWTSNGTITADTLTTRIEWGGPSNTTVKIFTPGGDTTTISPAALNVISLKDGSTVLAVPADSLGRIISGGQAAANATIALDGSGSEPALKLQASDGDLTQISTNTSDQMAFTGASGNYTFDNWQSKPDMLEFLGGALKETAAAGASDTTANYIPLKAFSVSDTATFDIFLSKRFASLDSIVVYAYSNTATSAVVFNCGVRQTAVGGTIAGAFNAAATKTISTGTAGTLRQWSMTSFGSLTASTPSMLVGKIYRTAGGTGGDVFVTRVLIYGVGLR